MFLMYNYIIAIFALPVKALTPLSWKKALFSPHRFSFKKSPISFFLIRKASYLYDILLLSRKENILFFLCIPNGTQGIFTRPDKPIVPIDRIVQRKSVCFGNIHVANPHIVIQGFFIHVSFLWNHF